MQIALPYPPSINHYWRHCRGRVVIGKRGRTFRSDVLGQLRVDGREPINDRIAVCLDAYPPDLRRRDLDNIQKPVLDALEHAHVYRDDSQIDLLITRRMQPQRPEGRIDVRIQPLPLSVCPLCQSVMNH